MPQPNPHTVSLYLAANPMECRVLLDGRDISDACRGIDVHAEIGDGRTRVVLHVVADVEIIGEPGRIEFVKPGAGPTP